MEVFAVVHKYVKLGGPTTSWSLWKPLFLSSVGSLVLFQGTQPCPMLQFSMLASISSDFEVIQLTLPQGPKQKTISFIPECVSLCWVCFVYVCVSERDRDTEKVTQASWKLNNALFFLERRIKCLSFPDSVQAPKEKKVISVEVSVATPAVIITHHVNL